MRRVTLLLLLAGCDRTVEPATQAAGAGQSLEAAAIAAGIVPDPKLLDPAGAYASDTDRVCVVPKAGGGYAIGASVDYGEGQGCVARGTATGVETLKVDLGDDCRVTARFDGTRLTFPASVPAACTRACTGRASLAALNAERLSTAPSEASALRDPTDRSLCTG
ncbi:hypothetical protein M0208_00835 [Sphingomonas sp. SUN019]|uniref:hypothetical protein n=1 Tax=Sphingomonas sp. SUN019 TaxID=2937788 RepID=UPI002164AF5E|nr:hypothetical protein [Sphingomonas sp. SUN019]UVO49134.1 hypothetical protein M0208_00835 [Sphingomonas sp. SUN019]